MYEGLRNLTNKFQMNMKNRCEEQPNKKGSLTKDFNHYVSYHTHLSATDIEYVKNLFQHNHIKKTLKVSLIILVWSILNSFFDVTLIGWGFVQSAVTSPSILHFVPWFLMVAATFSAKYFFVSKMDVECYFATKQKVLAALPSIGVLFFLSSVLAKEKLMLRTMRGYLRYVRNRGVSFIFSLLSKVNPLK